MPSRSSPKTGVLYVVATPIGNLEDMTPRAVRVLAEAALIAAEDTRHSAKLSQHFGIGTRMVSLHDYNERAQAEKLVQRLRAGEQLALISDAGTPLISDPGILLVRMAQEADIPVVPVPGACAAIAALSVSGLPTDHFVFEGFPPARAAARQAYFERCRHEPRTLVFYETPHRIKESLADMAAVFGAQRPALFARELTKQFETLRRGALAELAQWVAHDSDQQRGEIVVVVQGAEEQAQEIGTAAEDVLRVLLKELPVKQAAALAADITGAKKNALYRRALELAQDRVKK